MSDQVTALGNQITVTLTLGGGQKATAVVARDAIMVAVGDRACLAHQPWSDRATARLMINALRAFADTEPEETL